jgi:hypothetical protein
MYKWIIAAVTLGVVAVVFWAGRSVNEGDASGNPEERIVAYLRDNVRPGQPVYVTELHNDVFTRPEEQAALQRLYDIFFEIPAFAARIYTNEGRIPTLQEMSSHFQLTIPGEMDVLLRVMEADPRMPRFLERDPASGEIVRIDVAQIMADERFGRPLRNSESRPNAP